MANDLEKKIVQQIEYYFGDINLPRDKFMQEKIKEDEGWIPLDVLLTFKRLANLSTDPEVIVNAVEKAESTLVNVSEDRTKLRRNPEQPLPEMNETRQKELISRSAYAKGFPLDETLNNIITFLEPYGPIESCMRRTNLDKTTKQYRFKGSCFIIFKDKETCKKFVEEESIKYKDSELIRKWKGDYLDEKKKEVQERRKSKKEKKTSEAANVEANVISFPKGAVLHFSGIEKEQTLTREEIKAKIKEVGEIEPSYIDYNKGDLEGYVRLPVENSAAAFYEKLNDGQLEIGDIKLTFRVVKDSEEEEFLKKAADFRTQMRQNKKGKGRKRKGNFSDKSQRKRKV